MKSIKLSDFFMFKRASYVYLQITPDKSIRNFDTSSIVTAMALTYKGLFQHIKTEGKRFKGFLPKKFIYEETNKFTYVIDIEKNNVSFYFIVPEIFENSVREKLSQVWSKAKIEKVEGIKKHNEPAFYQLSYRKEDGLSLKCDMKDNDPLNAVLNVADIMKEGDRVTIYTNFMAIPQGFFKARYAKTMKMVRNKEILDKEVFTAAYIGKFALSIFIGIIDSFQETIAEFLGDKKKHDKELNSLELALGLLKREDLSNATIKKEHEKIIQNQILVVSESKDNIRKYINGEAVCQSYSIINENNELIYKETKIKNFDPEKYSLKVKSNYMSARECHNFVQLPGRELQKKYKINSINVLETKVPEETTKGYKRIGPVKYKDTTVMTYYTPDKDYKNLAIGVFGPSRSGKTTKLIHYASDSVNNNECVIVLDGIENCGLSEDIKKYANGKILEINCGNPNCMEGFGYNEAFIESTDAFTIYENAKTQASQLKALVNSINVDNKEFAPKMERYLLSAALVVFIQRGSIGDVFNVLQEREVRERFIESIPKEQNNNLRKYISYLKELNDDKSGGTKLNSIIGIIDRIGKLEENTYMELMLNRGTENNINLLEEMEKNQVILIKIPEIAFKTPEERDILMTYWATKIWMAGQVRAWKIQDRYARKTVNVLCDEIQQFQNAEAFIGSKLDQTAKFALKYILSAMFINQLRIREKLRTANTSYVFLEGSDKVNYDELKEELLQFEFTLEDMQNLERFHCLNYVKYEKGYTAFISQPLPKIK